MHLRYIFIIILVTIEPARLKLRSSNISAPMYFHNSALLQDKTKNVAKNLVLACDRENQENCSRKSYFSSSRKRRYLVFPTGASFQIVWDGILAVVDYTNYLIMGLTVALAWELPSDIPRELYKGLQKEVENLETEINHKDTDHKYMYYTSDSTTNLKQNEMEGGMFENSTNEFNWSMDPNMKHDESENKAIKKFDSTNNFGQKSYQFLPWIRRTKPMSLHLLNGNEYFIGDKSKLLPKGRTFLIDQNRRQLLPTQITNYKSRKTNVSSGKHNSFKTQRKYKIYPVFGKRIKQRNKRSGIINNNISKLDRIHIQYHRRSRQQLYKKIEKYLHKRSHQGSHCVLRALCETNKKSHERDPSSFVDELIRAVFTLPEVLEDESVEHFLEPYDIASGFDGNCATRYHQCQDYLWSTEF